MYGANDPGHEANVGAKQANAWGLYDMHGNVWEWCLDWYTSSYGSAFVIDPVGATSGSDRVLQGGHWSTYAHYCRSAGRYYYGPYDRNGTVGFRVCSAPVAQAADSDGDGMADAWEMLFFQSLKKTADGDADADGRTNAQEEIDNTDPTNPGSTLELVAYYPFDGDAQDATTNGNDGTINNSPFYIEGVDGQAIELEGSSSHTGSSGDHIIIPNSINISAHFSFSLWAKDDRSVHLNGHSESLITFGKSGGSVGLRTVDGEEYHWSVGSHSLATTNSYSGKWKMLTLIFDGYNMSVYQQGQFVSAVPADLTWNDPQLAGIGTHWWTEGSSGYSSTRLSAKFDEVRIYDRALSSNEVARLYAETAPNPDSDGDGMADAWEMQFFQGLEKTADGDADADGRTNAQEEIDNTDPTNPGSTLGLVAYYPFDGDATDATTNGHDGTTFNTTATAGRNGESNSAYQFNGVNSYVNVGSGINPPQFSVSTWIWFDSFLSGAIVSKLHGASPDLYKNFEISVNGGKLFAHIPNGSSWPSVTSEQMLKTNSWNHVIVTYDGATASLYIDGIEDQNHYSGNYVQSNVEVTIGARSDNGSPVGIFLDGSIDDVRIYNRALSSNEVARLYAETAPTNTGSSYQLVEGSFTWHQAKADAEAKGGHLACITSEEEWDDIRTQFDSEFRAGCFWLGATDETVEGNWT